VHRTEPISTAKLLQGDAAWDTCKKLLGWIVDSVTLTLNLPPRRLQRLADLLASIPAQQQRLALARWHKLLGELRSMALALPGARGLFSHLQAAIHSRRGNRLRLTQAFHHALNDFRWLHSNLRKRPTRLTELVPTTPILVGAHDASGLGAGGVWFPQPTAQSRPARFTVLRQPPVGSDSVIVTARPTLRTPGPIVWRCPFPEHIARQLCTGDNPHGTITNSDLELVGALWHDDVAAHTFDIRERTIRSATDNLATLYWMRRGSISATSPPATVLRQHALHQRFHRYLPLKDFIPGVDNNLADVASRSFHLDDPTFLTLFNHTFPQSQPWRLFHLAPAQISSGTSALLNKMSPLEWFLRQPRPAPLTGGFGTRSAPLSTWIRPFKTAATPSPSSKSLPSATDGALSTPATALSAVAPWKVPYAALAKRSRVWGPRISATPLKGTSTFAYNVCCPTTPDLTTRPHA
jgi:hypothetical protein